MLNYNHKEIEKNGKIIGQTIKHLKQSDNLGQKILWLDMFPYPSGAGLHVGHPEGIRY